MARSMNVLAVAIGGSLGALCHDGLTILFAQGPLRRPIVGISHLVDREAGFATTLANLSDGLLLGLLYQGTERLENLGRTPLPPQRLLAPQMLLGLRVGVLGSLTLFLLAALSVRGVLS